MTSPADARRPVPRCDVLVVGGGIDGVGVGRDLAGRGWTVWLVERDDLAARTSSSSTKPIHGGLRDLEDDAFALVRKSPREREVPRRSAPRRPDADFERLLATVQVRWSWLPPSLARRLARAHSSRIDRVIGAANPIDCRVARALAARG